MTESILNKFLDNNNVKKWFLRPKAIDEDYLPKIKLVLCQNQNIERCLKLIMEASCDVCVPLRCDNFIEISWDLLMKFDG